METSLQIVAFNIPYPPDYGGVIDVFYKLKALSECGVSIYLHCFEYDRPRSPELEKYCSKVFYYRRKSGFIYQTLPKPYIVTTRAVKDLLVNLSSNPAPILFEGLHSCYFLDHPLLKNHFRLVRTHNVEHEYYLNLFRSENLPARKLFFGFEFWKLKNYEAILRHADALICISPNDNRYFDQSFGNSHFIPAFHPFNEIKSQEGRGKYILFHGNLSISENIKAVDYLLEHVIERISCPVVVAGKNPASRLVKAIGLCSNVQLIENPKNDQMEQLIRESQICLIPTFQDTGLKLKLLASLFEGRYCITNNPMIHKTGLEHLCYEANTSSEMIKKINELYNKDFTSEEIDKRKLILEGVFSNRLNALKIIQIIRNVSGV